MAIAAGGGRRRSRCHAVEAGESDDENWTPYHLATPPVETFVPAATARAASPPRQPPPNPPGGGPPAGTVTPAISGSATSPPDFHNTPFPTQPTPMVSKCVNRGRWRYHELQVSR